MSEENINIFVHGNVDTNHGFFVPEGITIKIYSYPGLVNSCISKTFKYENVIDEFQSGDFIYNIHMNINRAEWNKSKIEAGKYTDCINNLLNTTDNSDLFNVCECIKRNNSSEYNVTIHWMSCLYIEYINDMCKSLSDIFLDYRFRDKKHKYKIINYITGKFFKENFKINLLSSLSDNCEIPFIVFDDDSYKFTIKYDDLSDKEQCKKLTSQNRTNIDKDNIYIDNSANNRSLIVFFKNPPEFEFQTKSGIENEDGGDVITPLKFNKEKIKREVTLDKLKSIKTNVPGGYIKLRLLIQEFINFIRDHKLVKYIAVCLSQSDKINYRSINTNLGTIEEWGLLFKTYGIQMELLLKNPGIGKTLETNHRAIMILLEKFYDKLLNNLLT